VLPFALALLVAASWIDKGLGLIIAGFTPNVFDKVTVYAPTVPELLISLGIFSVGALVVSILWKVALGVKEERGTL
jgi:molybdopterin-containing oxidoreductase family membrane subunit